MVCLFSFFKEVLKVPELLKPKKNPQKYNIYIYFCVTLKKLKLTKYIKKNLTGRIEKKHISKLPKMKNAGLQMSSHKLVRATWL